MADMTQTSDYLHDEIEILKRISRNETLLDVLVQIENFVDSLDLYVFKNWINGIVYEGPFIKRHWVIVKLKFDYKNMPDPRGGLRLIKHGCKVFYSQEKEQLSVRKSQPDTDQIQNVGNNSDVGLFQPQQTNDKDADIEDLRSTGRIEYEDKNETIWIIELRIPRRFIEELDDAGLDEYEDDVDIETASDARDEGLDTEQSIVSEPTNDDMDTVDDDIESEEEDKI